MEMFKITEERSGFYVWGSTSELLLKVIILQLMDIVHLQVLSRVLPKDILFVQPIFLCHFAYSQE
jgi:hypothetical protein